MIINFIRTAYSLRHIQTLLERMGYFLYVVYIIRTRHTFQRIIVLTTIGVAQYYSQWLDFLEQK